MRILNNKKGWIKIVEAFFSVLLIAGVLLFVINQGYIGKSDISDQVYRSQISVLREIELDNALRLEILSVENGGGVPPNVTNKIKERMPDYLECTSRICALGNNCPIPDESESIVAEKEVYAQAVSISAEGTVYGPVQLKMFCWSV